MIREDLRWFTAIETLDTGKPMWEAEGDVIGCADSLEMFAGFVPTLGGRHVSVPPNPAS